jgi:iron complex transport system substrate-binding protein
MDIPTMSSITLSARLLLLTVLIMNSLIAITSPNWAAQVNAADVFPMHLVDGFGRNVTIASVPERIVSLSPSNTEMLWAIDAGSKVVGVTRYCDYPPEVLARVAGGTLSVVGGFTDPNVEVIVSLQPDLVLASSDLQIGIVSSLEAKGLTVFAMAPKTIDDVVENVRLLGRMVGRSDVADRLADSMSTRIDIIVEKTRKVAETPRVYYEVWYDPLMSVGQGTYLNDLITLAGGANIFASSKAPYPVVNSESVIDADPQIIIVAEGYMGDVEEVRTKIRDRPGWSSIDAVRDNRIYTIDENIVYRHGPRIVGGLERLSSLIHPELFAETGLHSLIISTSPANSGVAFDVDGVSLQTDRSGSISLLVKNGQHTIRLLNHTIQNGPIQLEFLGWTGATSEKTLQVSIYVSTDSVLTASYYYSTVSSPTQPSSPQFNYMPVLVAVAIMVVAVTIVISLRTRHRESD